MTRTRTRRLALACSAALLLALPACGGGDDGASGDFCDDAADTKKAFDALDAADDAMDDPAELETLFTEGLGAIDTLSQSAPEEIADDFELLLGAYSEMVDVLEGGDWDLMAIAADPEAAATFEAMNTEEFGQAADNIDQYISEECGISLDGS